MGADPRPGTIGTTTQGDGYEDYHRQSRHDRGRPGHDAGHRPARLRRRARRRHAHRRVPGEPGAPAAGAGRRVGNDRLQYPNPV